MPLERNDRRMLLLGLCVVAVALALAGTTSGPKPSDGGTPPPPPQLVTAQVSLTNSGGENSETTFNLHIDETNLVEVSVTLSWQDEPASRPGLTNGPDELTITVSSPEGESRTGTDTSTSGSVTVRFTYNVTESTAAKSTSKRGMGAWDIVVEVGACGDQEPFVPDPLGLRTVADEGNAFTVSVSYSYFTKSAGVR